jgi:hypothetical protein
MIRMTIRTIIIIQAARYWKISGKEERSGKDKIGKHFWKTEET